MRVLGIILLWLLPMILIGGGLAILEKVVIWGESDFKTGKELTLDSLEFSMVVQDRDGKEIYRNFSNENREWIPLQEMPDLMQTATVIIEDKRFYDHSGVDFPGVARAMFKNIMAGRVVQGGSTLTQQVARKVFLTDERSYKRKIREMFIAFGVESTYDKEQILEMYLNTVPYGARINGIRVASQHYFDKLPTELSEAEMLVLSVMPKDPVRLSRKVNIKEWLGTCSLPMEGECTPFKDINYRTSRVESLLFAVAKEEDWDMARTRRVWEDLQNIKLPNRRTWVDDDFQHFRFYIERYLADTGFSTKGTNGLIIRTTLDSTLQKEVMEYMDSGVSDDMLTEHWIRNYAILILDHESRGPLVWIGSKDFWDEEISGQVDMIQARRQTGSTIKPFVYAGAIEKGYEPPTIFYDTYVRFSQDGSDLSNSDGQYLGGIRMSEALARSRNIPAAKALILAGGERVLKKYLDRNFGFDIGSVYKNHFFGWTLALGTAPVKIMDLGNAYATLGSREQRAICPVLSIHDFEGRELPNPCNVRVSRRIKTSTAFFVNNILSNESERPKDWNEILNPGVKMAIKTGTSSKRVGPQIFPVDDIVVGYTPKATVLLWSGNTDGRGLKPGSVAVYSVGNVWKNIAQKFLARHPYAWADFEQPNDLVKVNGEWATPEYRNNPPSYDVLNPFVTRNMELGLNPLYTLDHER